jgi:hypothetical protein
MGFFFEKKNQKTFARSGHSQGIAARTPQTGEVFLLLFLQKKKTLP